MSQLKSMVLGGVLKRTDTLHSFKMWPMFEWMVPNLHQMYFLIRGTRRVKKNTEILLADKNTLMSVVRWTLVVPLLHARKGQK